MPARFLRKILCSNMLQDYADHTGPEGQEYLAPPRSQQGKTAVSRWHGDYKRGGKVRSDSEHKVNYDAHTADCFRKKSLSCAGLGLTNDATRSELALSMR